jgi:(3R)-3-hydroxyacyl-CoA dehydrogenase / 3a,7a,12a-trihydroxy-5b-cholest-24-enoyl-CoA hydratase / enoyl-CoA hydratase 2
MALNLDKVGTVLGPEFFEYDEDDVILYALGVGVPPEQLQFLYEKDLKVLPTFAVIPARGKSLNTVDLLGISYEKLLHGENRIELHGPLPPKARIAATNTVVAIYDKGKGAVVVTEIEAREAESGKLLYKNISSAFVRGEGGFGGDRGPSGPKNEPPDRKPDAVLTQTTRPDQAILYRLSGDKNILHVDPEFAKKAGFERPILHGLCTYGHVGRAVLETWCKNEPAHLKAFEVRFSGVVYPGESLTTEMWKVADDRIVLRTKVTDDRIVIANAAAELA